MYSSRVKYVCSKYNHKILLDNSSEACLFNCLKGSLIKLPKSIDSLLNSISDNNPLLGDNALAENLIFSTLLEGGFIIPSDYDELKCIEKKFNSISSSKVLAVTIATTLDCNLACYYCYQKHNKTKLDKKICDKIILEIERRLLHGHYKKLAVDWYGGEPLLVFESIKYLSKRFMDLTSKLNIEYTATMVTNGTQLTPHVVDTLAKLKVKRLQVTLDGPPLIHNKNRPFIGGKQSFEAVMNGIKIASKEFDISIRINVNQETINGAYELLDILINHNVFSNKRKILPYISMIGPLTGECSNLTNKTIPVREFYNYVLEFQKEVLKKISNLEVEDVMEIPKPLNRGCGGQNPNSMCISPSGQVFKCGLDIHDKSLGASYIWEDYYNHSNYMKWLDLNPFKNDECINCKFLPLCMGGCGKYNFQQGNFYERESCSHWNNYLDAILKQIVELKKEKNNLKTMSSKIEKKDNPQVNFLNIK